MHFPEPSVAIYWFHSLLFAASITCSGWMLAALLGSIRKGVAIACILLCVEVLSMHIIFYNLFMLSDAMYTHLMLIGTTVILGGWMRHKISAVWIGYLALGLAAFTRPVGIILFPVWTLFALWLWLSSRKEKGMRWNSPWTLLLCIFFLIGPVVGWAGRNGIVYGYTRETAFGARNLLPHVLFLVEKDDRLLDDPVRNQVLIEHIDAFGKVLGTHEDTYRWQRTDTMPNIFDILFSYLPPHADSAPIGSPLRIVRDAFQLDSYATAIAVRIIAQHPLEYAAYVWSEYCSLLYPTLTFMQSDTIAWYAEGINLCQSDAKTAFFPPAGAIQTERISPAMGSIVRTIAFASPFRFLRSFMAEGIFYTVHAVLLLCLFFLWKHPQRIVRSLPFSARNMSVVLVMLIVTALSSYLFTAMLEEAYERYSLPGETELHLYALLCSIIVFHLIRPVLHSSSRASR